MSTGVVVPAAGTITIASEATFTEPSTTHLICGRDRVAEPTVRSLARVSIATGLGVSLLLFCSRFLSLVVVFDTSITVRVHKDG